MNERPRDFVLVHGAWHGGWCWSRVARLLTAAGHRVFAPSLSGLADHPIRWLEDDALKFVQREARRGSQYDGIVMDPPRFGHGPQGQVWEFFEHFPLLCAACRGILSSQPLFVVATVYALNVPPASLRQNLDSITHGLGGDLTVGELATRELGAGRVIPNALFGRWAARP